LIITFDESRGTRPGLTDPFLSTDPTKHDGNRIVTIFAGAHIHAGQYDEGKGINHVSILRTLEAMYGLPRSGAQQRWAADGGISDGYIIKDVFDTES
jgi:hypothetical protein